MGIGRIACSPSARMVKDPAGCWSCRNGRCGTQICRSSRSEGGWIMTVTEFLVLLHGVRKSGNGWEACCPAHEDRDASLSIREGTDGRILVHCHAGCPVESVVRALGLKM